MDSWPKQSEPLQRYTEWPKGRDCPAHSQSASSLPVIYRCPRLDTIHPESRIPVTLPQTLGTVFLHARLGNVRTLLDVNYKSVGVIKEVDILCWGTLWTVFTAIEIQWLYFFSVWVYNNQCLGTDTNIRTQCFDVFEENAMSCGSVLNTPFLLIS